MVSNHKVSITPDVGILSVLRHLNYKPWYALAEYVDNALDSFSRHKDKLKKYHGDDYKLIVEIDIDSKPPGHITIRDNAAGIYLQEFSRAFRPAVVPPDQSGLAEFGMGMKSASCWFAPTWSVRTSAFEDAFVRTVKFSIDDIVRKEIKELDVETLEEKESNHYTEIMLKNVFHLPRGKSISKIKEHLADIYRVFIREDNLELNFNGEVLSTQYIPILETQYYLDPEGQSKKWSKEIDFDFGDGLSVSGFAALRETASTSKAGFSLFRRGRVIEGSGDDGYRPSEIFGGPNTYRYQRLFGELHLTGFDVSHTKDGFRWDENEEPFLELLKEELDDEELPLLKQAQGYRVRLSHDEIQEIQTEAVGNIREILEKNLPKVLSIISDSSAAEVHSIELSEGETSSLKLLSFKFTNIHDVDWIINVELSEDLTKNQWVSIIRDPKLTDNPRSYDIRVSMVHPFMIRFAQKDAENLAALLLLASALTLAEILTKSVGGKKTDTIRYNMNEIILEVFSNLPTD